jgi:hypothetical protein
MKCGVEIASCGMAYIPSFMFSAGVQAILILRFCAINSRGYNVGIAGVEDL